MAAGADVIAQPKGGGALRGMGESFAPDLHTGAANFTIPITVPNGRGGATPGLALTYNSASANGPLGLGWTLGVPSITRMVSRGIPTYDDARDAFLMPGADELVPVDLRGTTTRYRPRREEMFAAIEHQRGGAGDYWRVRSKDGVTSLYGARLAGAAPVADAASIVSRPGPSARALAWLLAESRDPFGNLIRYEWAADEPADERARRWDIANGHIFRQRVLSRIRYVDYDDAGTQRFLVSVAFEYDDRPDRFSEYRAGFELRRALRCKRIVVRTHVDPNLAQPVRAYELVYLDERDDLDSPLPPNRVSLLGRVRMIGFEENSGGQAGAAHEDMAPLDLGYSDFDPARRRFAPIDGEDPPPGALSSRDYELADITGDGLPDVIELNGTARYWRNLGGRFDGPRNLNAVPAGVGFRERGVKLLDADGDGRADLLVEGVGGYFPLRHTAQFDPGSLRRYGSLPSVNLDDPEVRLLDLDGDGLTDVLRSGSRFECFFNGSAPEQAWTVERHVSRRSPATFPDVSFSDPAVRLADMSGDGLQDVVLVRGSAVQYWPNLGRGDWAPRVVMEHSPKLPLDHDPRRVLLGDVDGDGLADLVYVDDRSVTLWINQSGNGWSDPILIDGTPHVSDLDLVRLTDMRGSGVGGLLWAKGVGGLPRESTLYLDFCGGKKPYLLTEVDNNIGAVTRLAYTSSTEQRLEDEQSLATRWLTPMPFPMQVLAQVEAVDEISGSRQASEYRYRHGYWDGRDREFRGFGRVDVRDSVAGPGIHPATPTETRTWFHLGPVELETGGWTELDLSHEYWDGDASVLPRPPATTRLLRSLAGRRRRDAVRALKGSTLRSEVYARDDPLRFRRPYTVTESSYEVWAVTEQAGTPALVDQLPPTVAAGPDPIDVFFGIQRAVRTTQWERGDDPLTTVAYASTPDGFGRPRDNVMVALPRRSTKRAKLECAVVGKVTPDVRDVMATLTRRTFAAPDTAAFPDLYIHDRPAHTVQFGLAESRQVTETRPGDTKAVLSDQVAAAESARARIETLLDSWAVGDAVPQGVELLKHSRARYDGAAFVGRADGKLGPHGALTHSEELVLTDELLTDVYGTRRPSYFAGTAHGPPGAPGITAATIGYTQRAASADAYCDGWYAHSHRARFDAGGNIAEAEDPFGRTNQVDHDKFGLLPVRTTDPAGLVTEVENDYRVLQASLTTDPNGNATRYRFTPLGMLHKLWLEGREGEGGSEQKPETRFDYSLRSWLDTRHDAQPQPIHVHVTRRVHHAAEGISDQTLEHREYSDGFGRLVQERAQAEPLDFGDGGLPRQAGASPSAATGTRVAGRVLVSGSKVYDSKGRVVRKYEPRYDKGFEFAPDAALATRRYVESEYDPLGRMVKTVMADGSEQRVVLGVPSTLTDPAQYEPTPWESYTYDPTDLDGLRAGPYTAPTTARAPAGHHGTPTSRLTDALGRVLAQVERNGANPKEDWYLTQSHYDLRGNLVESLDPLGRSALRRGFDLLNRCLRIGSIDSGLKTAVLDAVGGIVEQRDGKGAFSAREYDRVHRLVRVWASDDGQAQATLRERLTYGDAGNPAQSATARTANRALNRLGRVASHWDEAGLLQLDRYDFIGNVIERTRRTIRDDVIAQGGAVDWSASGAASALESTRFELSTRYNALGRPVEITYPLEARRRPGAAARVRPVFELGYDESGALSHVELDGQPHIELVSYNAHGQPVLCVRGNGVMTRHAFDPVSFREARVRTERCTHAAGTDNWQGSGAPLQDSTYTYDPTGNVLSIEERVPGCGVRSSAAGPNRLTRVFTYDPQHRLVSATGRACSNAGVPRPLQQGVICGAYTPGAPAPTQANAPDLTEAYTESYRHDPVDNLLELSYSAAGGTSWKRSFGIGDAAPADWDEATSNRLTSLDASGSKATFQYDGAGNLIEQNLDRHQRFDHADRLIEHRVQQGAQPSLEARYLYGSDGRRVKKWVRRSGTQVESTVYIDELFELHRWSEQGQERLQNIVHVKGNEGRAALMRRGDAHKDDAGPVEQYHFRDQLGGSAVVTDDAATWVNREEWFPYGETSFGSFGRKRYRFIGKELDDESGLSYLGARYYSSATARFASCDTMISPPPGYNLNLYAYVRGNPISLRDPFGQQEKGYFTHEAPEKPFFQWGSGWNKTKADIAEWWESTFNPGGEDRTGAPEPPKPIDAKYFLPRPPPPAPKLREMVWKPAPDEFDKQWNELKLSVRGVAVTAEMAFIATDGIAPHAKYIFMIPGWHYKAVGYSLSEGAMLEAASIEMAEVNALQQSKRLFNPAPPDQVFFPGGLKVGPAFRTEAEAMAARQSARTHVAEVIHYDSKGNVIRQWWEVSETGLKMPNGAAIGRYGDTEQKALLRVVLKPGDTLEIRGSWSPCTTGLCCDSAMQATSIESDATIIYRFGNDNVWHYEAGYGRQGF